MPGKLTESMWIYRVVGSAFYQTPGSYYSYLTWNGE